MQITFSRTPPALGGGDVIPERLLLQLTILAEGVQKNQSSHLYFLDIDHPLNVYGDQKKIIAQQITPSTERSKNKHVFKTRGNKKHMKHINPSIGQWKP